MKIRDIKSLPKKFGYSDVTVLVKYECSDFWGEYYPDSKIIELYILDENDKILDTDFIIKTLCHELAHHIQSEEGILNLRKAHDSKFKSVMWQLLGMYYEGNIPQKVVDLVTSEEEILYEG